ncbi:MAG TPA: D-xylose ABC transporter substrate-binding protein [Pyrinomonadaceae bacterium]|nr:D-xylose ABC transporter substrate-binding protein [Pyrinomonadaceae bacterium]
MTGRRILVLGAVIIGLLLTFGCRSSSSSSANTAGQTKKIRIGFAMDALKQERWQKDRDLFLARAAELGADVLLQTADGNDDTQMRQVESLLTQGIDVLVIVPHNAEVAGAMVEMARRQNVPVISYDRLVKNCEPTAYVSFDNERVGELQAQYLFDRMPKGNYVLIGGAPTDNNSLLLRKGQLNILQAAIDRGDIKVVADQWAKEWLAEEALKHAENALTQNNNKIDAMVVSNDGTAGGVVEALKAQGLAGKVLVSGQDAELGALQRIVAGTQSMTVYKPISRLAPAAVEAAVALARGERLNTARTVNNGRINVPSILIEPIAVDKNNIDETVVKDGFQKRENIYKNIPPQ